MEPTHLLNRCRRRAKEANAANRRDCHFIEVLKLEIWEIWDVEIFVDDMFLLSNILEYMQLPG